MSKIAVLIEHKTRPGQRLAVRDVWMAHMAPAVTQNAGHEAYCYSFDNADPDVIVAFQLYSDHAAAQAFLQTPAYAAYVAAVEPLLLGPPVVRSLSPQWIKNS